MRECGAWGPGNGAVGAPLEERGVKPRHRCEFNREGFLNVGQPWLLPTKADLERARSRAVWGMILAAICAVCGWTAFLVVVWMR